MALPVDKAESLAKDMAKKGIPGMISMGEPKKHLGSGDDMDEAPEKDTEPPIMESIAGDIMSAIDKGDKGSLAKYLVELCERVAAQGSEPDMDEGAPEDMPS